MSDQRFLTKHRLRRGADFARVYARRCSASDERLLVFVDANELDHPRLGLSVSRKVGGAVLRNRWKRLLREAFRLNREQLPVGVDLVVIPRSAAEPELRALATSLVKLASKAAARLARGKR